MGSQNGKKRRGFTIRDSNEQTTSAQKEQRLAEHRNSKVQIGDRKSGLVKDRLIAQIGPGKYGELLKSLNAVVSGKDSKALG